MLEATVNPDGHRFQASLRDAELAGPVHRRLKPTATLTSSLSEESAESARPRAQQGAMTGGGGCREKMSLLEQREFLRPGTATLRRARGDCQRLPEMFQ